MINIKMTKSKKWISSTSDQMGFSLIEVIIAIGLSSVISLAIVKVNELSSKSSKIMDQKLDSTQFIINMEGALRNSQGCYHTFNGGTLLVDGSATSSIRDQNNLEIIAVGGKFGGLTLVSVKFNSIQALSSTDISISNPVNPSITLTVRERRAEVAFELRKGVSSDHEKDHLKTIGTKNIIKNLQFRFYVDPLSPDTIIACSGNEEQYLALTCDLFDGTLVGSDCRDITVRTSVANGNSAVFTDRVVIGAPPATPPVVAEGLCYKGQCITSWNVSTHSTLPCATVTGLGTSQVTCPAGMFVNAVLTNWPNTTLNCCPLEVR